MQRQDRTALACVYNGHAVMLHGCVPWTLLALVRSMKLAFFLCVSFKWQVHGYIYVQFKYLRVYIPYFIVGTM